MVVDENRKIAIILLMIVLKKIIIIINCRGVFRILQMKRIIESMQSLSHWRLC